MLCVLMLPTLSMVTPAVRDLYMPFPRPTAQEAIEQLAKAAEAVVAESDTPSDMIDAYGGRSDCAS